MLHADFFDLANFRIVLLDVLTQIMRRVIQGRLARKTVYSPVLLWLLPFLVLWRMLVKMHWKTAVYGTGTLEEQTFVLWHRLSLLSLVMFGTNGAVGACLPIRINKLLSQFVTADRFYMLLLFSRKARETPHQTDGEHFRQSNADTSSANQPTLHSNLG